MPNPFGPEPIEEIHLARAPLIRVLAQVRFEQLALFMKADPIAPFVQRISDEYPLLKEAHELQVVVGPTGASQQQSSSQIWEIRSQDSSWIVTVSNGSLALATSRYESREEFIARFEHIVTAFAETLGTPPSTRLGIRYTNQIKDSHSDPAMLAALIRPIAQGGMAIPAIPNVQLRHSFADMMFAIDDDLVQGRWGLLPEGTVMDPTLPPVAIPSLILDLDSFTMRSADIFSNAQGGKIRELSERAYRLFRWLITDEFIERFR